jgi:hypothetical protein
VDSARLAARLRPHLGAGLPGTITVGLMLVWAAHDGGYDADTWYWGALVLLAVLAVTLILRGRATRLSRASVAALVCLMLYVGWSFLSIAWAQSPGTALQGSDRALLYLLVYALMVALPWTPQAALVALLTFVVAVGVIGIVLLVRLASADLVIGGRLSAPTGYFNASAALFSMDALAATVLATRRRLPALLRGVLIAFACAGLQLALTAQSRGWLFTVPLVMIAAIVVVPDRLRVAAAAVIPIAAVLLPLRRFLAIYQNSSGPALDHASIRAGHAALLTCGAACLLGTLIAWGETQVNIPSLTRARRRLIGSVVTAIAIASASVAGVGATHGHPFRFIQRQWRGFSHTQTSLSTASHFADVGSGRYDFWRVALDAVIARPVGGLGQDNFADYYITHRHSNEEPAWTHSLELRLLAHTGFVGFGLFAAFLIAAIAAALRARRWGDPLVRGVGGAALLPLLVWLIHGSIDWFWEFPALSGPALGFLGVAGALGRSAAPEPPPLAAPPPMAAAPRRWQSVALRIPRTVAVTGATTALLAGAIVLGLPYLSVREVSLATEVRSSDPAAALRDLSRAATLNPLNADPGRLAGVIALQIGHYATAEQRFSQSISREPGGWLSWLGRGLAASALGDRARAHHDFEVALSINSHEFAVSEALARSYTRAPLTPAEAFKIIDALGS